jgi:hypothetical protein
MKLWQPENPLGIYYKVVDTAASSTTIVLGRLNQQIVLISASIIVSTNTAVQWYSSTGPTELSGPQSITATGGYILPYNAGGWLQTAIGDSLILTITPNVQIGGMISYVWINQPGN